MKRKSFAITAIKGSGIGGADYSVKKHLKKKREDVVSLYKQGFTKLHETTAGCLICITYNSFPVASNVYHSGNDMLLPEKV